MHEVIVLPHDQPVHQSAGIDPGAGPAIAGCEWTMRQIIKKQAEGHSHHQSRRKPAVENEGQEIKVNGCKHNHQEDAAFKTPLKQFPASPESFLKEEEFVIKKSWGNQSQRAERAHDVIRVVHRVVHMGVMLEMHPGENRETEAEQQC